MKPMLGTRIIIALTTTTLAALVPLADANEPRWTHPIAQTPPPDLRRDRVFIRHLGDGEKETVAFLGVETIPVSPALTAQLGLPKGAGLAVRHLVPDSPAAATLQVHDVLLKLDDQLLITTRQLAVLVRNHKEGDEVELTFVRSGKQSTVKVKLSKHESPKLALDAPEVGVEMAGEPSDVLYVNRAGTPPEEMHRVLSLLDHRGEPARLPLPRGAGVAGGFHGVAVNPANSNMVFTDEQGTLELTIKEGKKTLVAKNAKGEQIYSGPVDRPEQRASLPKEVRARLEKIEGMQEFSFEPGPEFHGEVDVLRPRASAISFEREILDVPDEPGGAAL